MAHTESDLQAALDNKLSSPEQARLAAHLERNPQAREDYERLKNVDAALRNLESVDPPGGLRQDVMRQVRLKEALKDSSVRAGRSWFVQAWEGLGNTRPVFQLGLGFALGVLVLLPAIWNSPELSLNPGHVAGTLSRSHSDLSTVLTIQGPGIKGEVLKSTQDGEFQMELRLDSETPVLVSIISGSPVSLVSWESEPATPGTVQFDPDRLGIQHAGVAAYRFRITSATDSWPSLSIRIEQDGLSLFQESIP